MRPELMLWAEPPPPAMQQGRYVNESCQIHAFDDPGWNATMSQ